MVFMVIFIVESTVDEINNPRFTRVPFRVMDDGCVNREADFPKIINGLNLN